MSRRVTYESKITDRDLAITALGQLNMAYQETGKSLRITSGPLREAQINLSNGAIESDSDYDHNKHLNELKIAYTEAEARREYHRSGTTILARDVVTYQGVPGVVRLSCRRAVG